MHGKADPEWDHGVREFDPVCGSEVPERSNHLARLDGAEYRFCSADCLRRFTRHPEAFVDVAPDVH